jgi:hypothetical protein
MSKARDKVLARASFDEVAAFLSALAAGENVVPIGGGR